MQRTSRLERSVRAINNDIHYINDNLGGGGEGGEGLRLFNNNKNNKLL